MNKVLSDIIASKLTESIFYLGKNISMSINNKSMKTNKPTLSECGNNYSKLVKYFDSWDMKVFLTGDKMYVWPYYKKFGIPYFIRPEDLLVRTTAPINNTKKEKAKFIEKVKRLICVSDSKFWMKENEWNYSDSDSSDDEDEDN